MEEDTRQTNHFPGPPTQPGNNGSSSSSSSSSSRSNNNNNGPSEIHPMLPRGTRTDGRGRAVFSPAMRLPAADDAGGILEFLGLDRAMADIVLSRLETAMRQPAAASANSSDGLELVDRVLRLYLERDFVGESGRELSGGHGGNLEGLRPEFARCFGLVEVNRRYRSGGGASTRDMFFGRIIAERSHRDDADRIVARNADMLKHLWWQKRVADQGRADGDRGGTRE